MDKVLRKASEDALYTVTRLVAEFPGLIDGETDIDASDVVDALMDHLRSYAALKQVLNNLPTED